MIPTVKLPIDNAGDSSTVTVTFPFADLLNGDSLANSQAGLTFTYWSPPNQPGVTFGTPKLSGTNWINDVTIAGAKAGKTFYVYCRAETVGNQTLISQVNVLTTGVNPLANSPVTPTPAPTSTATPNIYLPDGWDAGWLAAISSVQTTPINVSLIGDSILNGGVASNLNSTSVRALLRAKLIAKYGLHADYIPNFNGAFGVDGTNAWGNNGANTNERWGFGYMTVPNGSGGTNTLTFNTPYACTQIDIIYLDQWPGTWSYNLDGGGNTIVTNTNNNASGAQSYAIKRISLTGLAATTHTIVFASQSAAFTCAVLGCVCYPNGPAGGGINFAPHTYAGTLLTDKIAAYALNSPTPSDMCWIHQGASPLSYNPGTPSTAVTAAAPSAGGSVDVGTHYYAMTYYGGFGETSVGTSTSAAVTVTSGNQTVALSTIANNQVAISPCPYATAANKNLYRTKASGTGSPGSGTNPYYLLAQLANGTTTYTDTTADSALTNQQPPAAPFSWTPAGVFGFPTMPHLAVIGMGANDIGFNYSTTNVSNFELALKRLVRAIKRGQSKTSIIIWVSYMPDGFSSDGGAWGNSVNWSQYTDAMYNVAAAENCALINNDARWQPFAVTNGFGNGTDVHPTDAGNADELIPLVSVLGL